MKEASKDPYFQVKKVRVKTEVLDGNEMKSGSENGLNPYLANEEFGIDFKSALDVGSGALDIVGIFIKAWDLIQKNKAVANVETKSASALPLIAGKNWTALTGWKPEKGIKFTLEIENAYGMKTVDLEYQVRLEYGGSYHGKGLYIASARVIPTRVKVLWGYNLDMKANVASILNVGTEKNPVGQIALDVSYSYGTILKTNQAIQSYVFRADGMIQNMTSGQKY